MSPLPQHVNVEQLVGAWTQGDDCGPAGGAAIVAFVTYGEVEPTAYQVRRFIRPPDNGPTHVRQIAQALRDGYGVEIEVESPGYFDEMWRKINNPLVICTLYVQYSALRGTRWYVATNGFGGTHTVTVSNADGDTCSWADPLAKKTTRITKAALLKATAATIVTFSNGRRGALGAGRVIAGYAPAPAQAEQPEVDPDPMDNLFPDTFLSWVIDLPVGTKFYEDPALTVPQGKVGEPDEDASTKAFALLGAPMKAGSIWRVANGDRGVFVKRTQALTPRRLKTPKRVGA